MDGIVVKPFFGEAGGLAVFVDVLILVQAFFALEKPINRHQKDRGQQEEAKE